jgi:hypothetical protein
MIKVGWVLAVASYVWVVIQAFAEDWRWGLGSLILPVVGCIYVITRWPKSKKATLVHAAGYLIILLALALRSTL